MNKKLREKLENYTISENGCWEWAGNIDKKGYGRVYYHGNSFCAHRVRWELCKGSIPPGAFILHTCGNRKCSNLKHLYISEQRKYVKKNAAVREKAFVRTLSVVMSREMFFSIKGLARRRNCTVSKLIRRMIFDRVRKEESLK